MVKKVITFIRQRIIAGRIPEGESGIALLGHRRYVGGQWDKIGKMQFDFIVTRGMKTTDCFLDVACGALRGGVHYINYLEKGNYLGIDKEQSLIDVGIEKELGKELYDAKAPEFVLSDSFEFEKFSKKPQYAIALSLFTHLNPDDIQFCLRTQGAFVEPGHQFYATFFEGKSGTNRDASHSLDHFEYSKEEMIGFGKKSNWAPTYIGNWDHPRDQMMMLYTSK